VFILLVSSFSAAATSLSLFVLILAGHLYGLFDAGNSPSPYIGFEIALIPGVMATGGGVLAVLCGSAQHFSFAKGYVSSFGFGLAFCLLFILLGGLELKDGPLAAISSISALDFVKARPLLNKGIEGRIPAWFPIREYLFSIGTYSGPLSSETAVVLSSQQSILKRPLLLLTGSLLGSLLIASPTLLSAVIASCYVGKKLKVQGEGANRHELVLRGFVFSEPGLILLTGLRFAFLLAGVPEARVHPIQLHEDGLNPVYSIEVRGSAILSLEAYLKREVPSFSLLPGAGRRFSLISDAGLRWVYYKVNQFPEAAPARFRNASASLFSPVQKADTRNPSPPNLISRGLPSSGSSGNNRAVADRLSTLPWFLSG
jgi:hypothetical protein